MKLITGLVAVSALALSGQAFSATPLVDVSWIKQHSCDDNVRVLDIRNALDGGSRTLYLKGHIPCAVYTDYLKGGWRTMVDKVPGQLPPTEKIAKLIGDLGIDNDTHVVVYHHGKNALDLGTRREHPLHVQSAWPRQCFDLERWLSCLCVGQEEQNRKGK